MRKGLYVRGRKKYQYAVSSTLIKEIPNGSNIMSDLRPIKAFSKEEAMGKYILEVNEQFPEHHIHIRPITMVIG